MPAIPSRCSRWVWHSRVGGASGEAGATRKSAATARDVQAKVEG